MNKKILTLLVILAITVGALSVVSAADTHEVNGVKFNIPDGYTYDQKINEMAYKEWDSHSPDSMAVFSNGGSDELIYIFVEDNMKNQTLKDMISDYDQYPEKTINGKTGIYNDNADGKQSFAYLDGKKAIVIIAPDESVMEQCIVK